FQAEDGIRDATVTGVQTCALPICAARGAPGAACLAHPPGERALAARGPEARGAPRARRRPAGRRPDSALVDLAVAFLPLAGLREIGRASCREAVEVAGGRVSVRAE